MRNRAPAIFRVHLDWSPLLLGASSWGHRDLSGRRSWFDLCVVALVRPSEFELSLAFLCTHFTDEGIRRRLHG
jgi:hypothetical protein